MLLCAGECARAAEAVASPPCGERYFVIIFGYQDCGYHPKRTHTFVTFVKVDQPCQHACTRVQAHTISWLPASFGSENECGFAPQRGHNYTLAETLHFAANMCLEVRHWGPYEIDRELYCLGMQQIRYLESGQAKYRMLAPLQRILSYHRLPGGAMNCIHATADAVGYLPSGIHCGYGASQMVVNLYEPYFLGRTCHPWVLQAVRECEGRGPLCGR